jgi:hypothetical protein
MQHNMVQIRNQFFVTHGENANTFPEAIIISLQFPFACAEYRIIPVAHELYDKPERQDSKQYPFPGRLKAMKQNDTKAVQAEHGKLGTLGSDTFYKKVFSDPVCDRTSQEPYP